MKNVFHLFFFLFYFLVCISRFFSMVVMHSSFLFLSNLSFVAIINMNFHFITYSNSLGYVFVWTCLWILVILCFIYITILHNFITACVSSWLILLGCPDSHSTIWIHCFISSSPVHLTRLLVFTPWTILSALVSVSWVWTQCEQLCQAPWLHSYDELWHRMNPSP